MALEKLKKLFAEGVKELKDIREKKVQPFLVEKIAKPVVKTAQTITEKIIKPLLKGELPVQKQVISFLDKGQESRANEMISQGLASNLEDAKIKIGLEDAAWNFVGGMKNVGMAGKEVIKELVTAPRIKDTVFSALKKQTRRIINPEALTKYGEEGGEILNKVRESEKYAVLNKSKSILNMDSVFKTMTEQDFVDFGDMVEGLKPITPTAEEAVKAWKGEAKHIANAAQKYGIQIKAPIKEVIYKTDEYIPLIDEKIEKEFTNDLMEGNYQGFKELLKDPKIRSPKVKEAITNGDLETFRKELVDRGIMDSAMVDNITYSQEMSGDEVLSAFKDRLLKENPGLLVGKQTAEQLGLKGTEEGTKQITRTITKKIPFTPRENYYPYFLKEDELEKIFADQTKYNDFLEQMAEKGKMTVAKAHEIIQDMVNGRADFYGHLERARTANLPKELYERDPRKILSQYISQAWDRLGDAKFLGGDDSILQELIEKARQKGEDFEEIQELTNRVLGREKFNEGLTKVSQFARNYNNITKLSLAAATNLGDLTKSFIRSGFYPTLKGIVQSFTKTGKQFAGETGVIEPVLQQFAKEQGIGQKFFKYTGFQASEQKLRQIASNAAKNYVDILYSKLKRNPANNFVKRRLEQFGLDAEELLKRGLKKSDYLEAGYQAIADTQPISRADIPYYWQSPTGKILSQYKSFALKQYQFSKKFIWEELKKGNPKPVLTFLVIGSAVGEGIGDLKAWLRGGRERPDKLGPRIIDNLMTIGGLGLATDFISNLQYGSMGGGFLKFVAGPTFSDIDAWLTAIQGDVSTIMDNKKKFQELGKKSVTGKVQPKTVKKALYSMPFFGPALSNQLFPTRSTYKARTIPIAEEILQLIKE